MSVAVKRTLDRQSLHYLLTVVIVIAAFLLQKVLVLHFGLKLPAFLTLYPALIGVSLSYGLRAGLLATALGAVLVDYRFMPPFGSLANANYSQAVALAFWVGRGIVMSVVGNGYRRYQKRIVSFKTQEGMSESEARLAAVVQTAPLGIVIHGADGHILRVNAQAQELLGVGDPIGKDLTDPAWQFILEDGSIMPMEDFPVAQVLAHKLPVTNLVLGIKRVDQRPVWVLLNALPRFGPDGDLAEVTVGFMDISERKRAEEALHVTEERFRALVLASSNTVYSMGPDWSEMRYLVGKDFIPNTEAPSGTWVQKYIHPDDQPRVWAAINEAIRTRTAFELEHRVRRVDGSLGWTFSRAIPLQDAEGNILEWFGAASDITERKLTELALQENAHLLALALEASQSGYFDWDLANKVSHWSPEVERLYGLEPGVYRGSLEQWREWVVPEDLPLAEECGREALQSGSLAGEWRVIRQSDGEIRWLSAHGKVLHDASGKPVRLVGIALDITERKRAEAALVRSEKLASVGRMAATIAHEINNPLGAVTNLLYLVKGMEGLPESGRQYLEMAEEELRRVAHITRQSLGFYRESNAPALTSVNAILESAIDLLKSKIKAKHAKIDNQCNQNVEITAVAGELRQVFSNLLSNSLDAIEQNGSITLRVASATSPNGNHCVRITIADNGKGIPANSQRHIFEPFFTTKGTIGTGLGLWVSKQIIDNHKGTIRVRSSASGPRTGTVFSITLPMKSAAAASKSAQA
jgi:PAS domain S-box-containing protein